MVFHLGFPAGVQADTAYTIERSLLCDGASHLSWTPGSAGDLRTWVFSIFAKRADLGGLQTLFSADSNAFVVRFGGSGFGNDAIEVYHFNGSTYDFRLVTTAEFRDPSAHYHIVVELNTPDATASERVKLRVNGERITDFVVATYPSQNFEGVVASTVEHNLAKTVSIGSTYFAGLIAEPSLIVGQTDVDADDFGQPHPTVPQFWIPKKYTGAYGANGFYLPFSNNASTTTLGEDASGNGNDFTLTGFTVDDSVEDTPTNNFAVMNPLSSIGAGAFSEGNLFIDFNGYPASGAAPRSTIGMSEGRWYWEVEHFNAVSDALAIGVHGHNRTGDVWQDNHLFYYGPSGQFREDATVSSYGATFTAGDIIGVALDVDANEITFYKNGIAQGTRVFSIDPETGAWFASVINGSSAAGNDALFNFGQKPFAHTPPAGFQALSTANLDNPGEASPLTGSFTGNASADGRFVYLGYPPDTAGVCTINSNAITWGTHADALANGFKLRTSSAAYNASGSNSYSIAIDPDASFADNANAQVN